MGQGVVELNVSHTIFLVSPIHMDCMKPKVFALGSILENMVHNMMYVPVPQIVFFRKIPRSKKALFVYVGPTNFFFFIGIILFHWSNLFCEIYEVRPSATKLFFSEKSLAQKRLCLSMWDWCRFTEPAKNPSISSNKVVISTSGGNKALIITFMLKNAL